MSSVNLRYSPHPCLLYTSNNVEDLKAKTDALIQKNQPTLYLDITGCKLLRYDFSEPITENHITFTQWNRNENKELTEDDILLLNYFKALAVDTELPAAYRMTSYSATTADGAIDIGYNLNTHSILGLNEENVITRRIRDFFPDAVVNEYYQYGGKRLDVTFPMEISSDSLKALLDNFQKLYEDKNCAFNDGSYDYINFYWSENDRSNQIHLCAYNNSFDARTELFGSFSGPRLESCTKEISDYLIQSEFYKANSYTKTWSIGNTEFSYVPKNNEEDTPQ